MEIVNRIKAQLSLAAAAQRQINQRNAAMISQKANLLRNFQMESNKAQSKFFTVQANWNFSASIVFR